MEQPQGGASRRPRLRFSSCSGPKIRRSERTERCRFGSLTIPEQEHINESVVGGW
jgi:hypothetical protein